MKLLKPWLIPSMEVFNYLCHRGVEKGNHLCFTEINPVQQCATIQHMKSWTTWLSTQPIISCDHCPSKVSHLVPSWEPNVWSPPHISHSTGLEMSSGTTPQCQGLYLKLAKVALSFGLISCESQLTSRGSDQSDGLMVRTGTIWGTWWRHDIEMLTASLAICDGNSLFTDGFPSQRDQ